MKTPSQNRNYHWIFYTCFPLTSLLALDTKPDENTTTAQVQDLQDYVVYAPIPIEESVLPTARPTHSVYGMDMSVLDTPRNVTIISREQLDAISIKDPRDFAKLTTSSYTCSNFGAPTTPSIRGQIADTLVNGMRKGLSSNGNGLPLNFNSVESVNILKGPPSVMVGVSQYVGGYVDLITKKPTFDRNTGSATVTVDSEGMQQAQIDQNFVISETLAVRLSLTGEDSTDYYWDDFKRQTTAIYAALTWIPHEDYTLELNSEYFKANYTDNWGINRPSDDLIDHGTYVTGIGSVTGGFDSLTTTGTTQIDRKTRLHGKGDDSNGEYFALQGIQTFTGNPDLTVVNNTFFQYLDRDTYGSYQYSEVLRDNTRFENRTEFRTDQRFAGLLHKLNLGLSLSYQDVWAANDYYHEPANAWDLANQSDSDIGVTDSDVYGVKGARFFYNAFPISGEGSPGKLSGFPGSSGAQYVDIDGSGLDVWGNGDSNDSQTTTLGIFLQDQVELDEQWLLLIGGRLDYVYVESKDPMFKDMLRFLESEGTNTSELKCAKDTHGDFVPNFNTGLVYKISDTQSLYANYNYSESIPAGIGGGVPLDNNTSTSSRLDENGFDIKSELYEFGYKSVFLDHKLFYSATVFYQTRTDQSAQAGDVEIKASGFETELSYQPSRKFFFTAGYSYLDSVSSNGTSITRKPIDSVPSNGGIYQYNNFASFKNHDTRTPGLPRNIFNGLVAYNWTDHLSTTVGILVTSPIPLGYNISSEGIDSAEIPWQYSTDFGIQYETKRYAIKLSVLNLTDEENWGAVNGLYGNDSIYAELPRRYELAATIKW